MKILAKKDALKSAKNDNLPSKVPKILSKELELSTQKMFNKLSKGTLKAKHKKGTKSERTKFGDIYHLRSR